MNLIFALALLLPSVKPMGYIKSSDLKPGMKGYGLTVFRGTVPVKFKVEVISVIPNGLGMIKQNLILVKCSHPIINHAGIIAGMSGSPIFIKGKFAGGLGYGFSFQKDPIAMLTPAEAIIGTMKRPVKNYDIWGRSKKVASVTDIWGKTKIASAWKFKAVSNKSTVQPLKVALSVGGVTGKIFSNIFPNLAQMGPIMPAGSIKSGKRSPYVPGGPVAIWMVSGDVNVAAIGTVTQIIGNRMSVFSHPFMMMGDTRMPAAHAFIHTVIARSSSSMKLGTMTYPEGALIRDEQATVVIDKSLKPGHMPMSISITGLGEKARSFNYKVARNRFITARMVDGLVRVSLTKYYQNQADLTYTLDYEFKVTGLPPIKFSDSFSSQRGILVGWWGYKTRGSLAINLLLNNPFTRVGLEYVKVKAHIVRGLNLFAIKSIELPSPVIKVGQTIPLKIKLKPLVGKVIEKTVKFKLPDDFKGTRVTLEVTSGRFTSIDEATPTNLNQVVNFISKSMDSHNLVLTIKTPHPAVDIEGIKVKDIPLSVVDSLVRQSSGIMRKVKQTMFRKIIRTPQLLKGRATISVLVKKKENEAE
jgi:hypothetical protein